MHMHMHKAYILYIRYQSKRSCVGELASEVRGDQCSTAEDVTAPLTFPFLRCKFPNVRYVHKTIVMMPSIEALSALCWGTLDP